MLYPILLYTYIRYYITQLTIDGIILNEYLLFHLRVYTPVTTSYNIHTSILRVLPAMSEDYYTAAAHHDRRPSKSWNGSFQRKNTSKMTKP